MKRNPAFFCSILFVILALAACSGLPQNGGGGGGGGGTGTTSVSLTLSDTPPAGVSILSFKVVLSVVQLEPATGTAVPLLTTPVTVDLATLQSDSFFAGTFDNIAAATFANVAVGISSYQVVFVNDSGATIGTCTNTSVCTAGSALPQTARAPIALTLVGSQPVGLNVDFNLSKALTATLTADFSVTGALTAATLPRTGQSAGTLDTVEDFTGVVESFTANTLTVKSDLHGTQAVTVTTNTLFHDPQSLCVNPNTCLQAGQTVSVDATLGTNGLLTATEVDFIDLAARDEIEGTLFFTGVANQFGLVVSDKSIVTTTNATLSALAMGDTATVAFTTPIFFIDTKGLPVSSLAGFSSSADLFEGQTVRVHVSAAVAGTGGIQAAVTTDSILLRFSRISGTVAAVGGTTFDVNGLPPIIQSVFLGNPQVQTFVTGTVFDGVNSLNELNVGDSVSFRALFLNSAPAFFAAKVRKH